MLAISICSNCPPYDGDIADALLITPGPKSTKYALSLTTTAYDEPYLSGSGLGVPEPKIINLVSENMFNEKNNAATM